MKSFKTGVTLSATVVLFYALCTLVWLAFPEPFMNFMNALFHGLDFRRLRTDQPFSWWSVAYPAIVFAVWSSPPVPSSHCCKRCWEETTN